MSFILGQLIEDNRQITWSKFLKKSYFTLSYCALQIWALETWGVCNCSMFCCTLLYVHSSITIILMGKRELIDLLYLSSWCLVMVERLFLAVPRGCLQFVIVVFSDHTHLLFWKSRYLASKTEAVP